MSNLIARLVDTCHYFKIPKEEFPNGLKVIIKSGAGEKGEGDNGGDGGFGQIKEIIFNSDEDVEVNAYFLPVAKNGQDAKSIALGNYLVADANKGGRAGLDVYVKFYTRKTETNVMCFGGGGGGGGGTEEYITVGAFAENRKLVSLGGAGGANGDGILKYGKNYIFGGRGQDGDSESSYDIKTKKFESAFEKNEGIAEVLFEVL